MGDPATYDAMGDFGSAGADPGTDLAAPIGAGGDPYGGDGSDYPQDAASTGVLPGGGDGQYSPFSPNGGFDFTDVLKLGGAGAAVQPAWWAGGGATGRGSYFGGGSGTMPGIANAPNLGIMPMPPPGGPGQCQPTTAQRVGMIVRSIRQSTGLRVSAKSLVSLLMRYGFPATAQLTGAQPSDLLFVFFAAKGVRHHRRGPGLYTIGRKLRAADRLRKRAAKILGRQFAHSSHHHGGARRRKGKR